MFQQGEQSTKRESRAIAHSVSQRKEFRGQKGGFADKRLSTIIQQKPNKPPTISSLIVKHHVRQLAQQKFKPTFPEPNPLVDGRRYWKNSPASFTRGLSYWNSNHAKYKKTKDNKEIHATIDAMSTANKAEKLRDSVKNHPSWAQRNVAQVGNRIDLSSWTESRSYVTQWHISIKDGSQNVGGWFGITGTAALPQYADNGHAATTDQTTAANQIHSNMNHKIL